MPFWSALNNTKRSPRNTESWLVIVLSALIEDALKRAGLAQTGLVRTLDTIKVRQYTGGSRGNSRHPGSERYFYNGNQDMTLGLTIPGQRGERCPLRSNFPPLLQIYSLL